MCKMHIRWIESALSERNMTSREIMETMVHRRSCPTMNELSNYLSKNPKFYIVREVNQRYITRAASSVAIWGMR
jgi:hypothetical protein